MRSYIDSVSPEHAGDIVNSVQAENEAGEIVAEISGQDLKKENITTVGDAQEEKGVVADLLTSKIRGRSTFGSTTKLRDNWPKSVGAGIKRRFPY